MNVIEQLIPLADSHQAADEYISGAYWRDNGHGKGCAVGCTIHDAIKIGILPKGTNHGSHVAIAQATGVPKMVWRLADLIFEGLPESDRPAWTPRFLRSVKVNTDYQSLPARIMARLANRLASDAVRGDVGKAAELVAKLWERRSKGDEPTESEWRAAREQTYAARDQFWQWCADVVCEELAR